ncbi:pilus assembly protein PilM [Candidatus Zixiibacteriota bacterium]
MACALHLGHKVKILDVNKEYFPKKNFDKNQKELFISHCINEFTEKYKRGGVKVILSLAGQETIFRTFFMPNLSKKDLHSAIVYEVDKQIPFPVEDCNFDYRTVYKVLGENQSRYKITLHATTKREIHNHLKQFIAQDIKVEKVYHAQDVIGQLLQYFPDFDEDTNYTLLNIGLNSTEISFYKGTTLEFSHSSSLSSSMLGSQGDQLKYEYFAETILNEIQNSLDYYAGQFTAGYSNDIYVYGDFAYSNELLSLINEKSGITLKVFPIENFSFLSPSQLSMPEIYPSCLTVIAAAVNRVALADLLPHDDKSIRHFAKGNSYLKLSAAIAVLFFVLSWSYFNNSLDIKEQHHTKLTRQVEYFVNSEAYHTYNMIKREIAFDIDYLNKAKESPSYFHLNLKELSNITPKAIKLIHFNYEATEDKNLFMQGVVQSDNNIPPEVILAEFIENLIASPFYEQVTVVKHIKKEIKRGFQIEFHLKMRGIA